MRTFIHKVRHLIVILGLSRTRTEFRRLSPHGHSALHRSGDSLRRCLQGRLRRLTRSRTDLARGRGESHFHRGSLRCDCKQRPYCKPRPYCMLRPLCKPWQFCMPRPLSMLRPLCMLRQFCRPISYTYKPVTEEAMNTSRRVSYVYLGIMRLAASMPRVIAKTIENFIIA